MRGLRFSVGGLLALILLSGLSLACLRFAAAPWAGIARVAYFTALAFAPMMIAYRRGSRRASWFGFAMGGWGYLAYLSIPFVPESGRPLVTERLLAAAYPRMIPHATNASGSRGIDVTAFLDKRRFGMEAIGNVDVRIGIEDDAPLLAEGVGASIMQVLNPGSNSGIYEVQAMLILDEGRAVELAPRLEAESEGRRLVLVPSRPGFFANLGATLGPPTDLVSFKDVGHAIFGMLAGFMGGLVGCLIQATGDREAMTGGAN